MPASGRPRASAATRQEFWDLVRHQGISHVKAADMLGMSRSWAWRMIRDLPEYDAAKKELADKAVPAPKDTKKLDGGVKDTLRDFNLFSEAFFCRRPAPWRYDAAMRAVEALLDPDERTYLDINTPPGAGKTTLFTHDIPLWLVCGGGFLDTARGRALRMMLGAETGRVAVHYVLRCRNSLERIRPFYDRAQKRQADLSLPLAFGRFKPLRSEGDLTLWQAEQFLVAQLQDIDVVEKEPTFQAASRESGFLGERVDYAAWDDITTVKNSRSPEVAQGTNDWFTDEAETRVEPGGVLGLVGQRLGPLDLHRKRLDASYTDDSGMERKIYRHIVYPAHHEATCDVGSGGSHRQWDLEQEGCLLDAYRLPWSDLVKKKDSPTWETVYQQKDIREADVLVPETWLTGGTDADGYPAPGCLDPERGFMQWPTGVGPLVNYATVDPAAGNWWVCEWWAVQLNPPHRRYLIWGCRRKMQAGKLLDWDPVRSCHVGLMEELQNLSCSDEVAQPILVWVVEATAAFKHLVEYEHYRTWRRKWVRVHVEPQKTWMNKIEGELRVQAILPMVYKTGLKSLPDRRGDPERLNYLKHKRAELTSWPHCDTQDTVMADWFGEYNMAKILAHGRKFLAAAREKPLAMKLPAYLTNQSQEINYAASGAAS